MKLCILLPSLELGGTERRMVLLAEQLKNKGHEVEICTLRQSGVFVDQVKKLNIPMYTLAKGGRYDLLAPLIRLLSYFKTKQFDAVLSCLPSANLYALAIKVIDSKIPLIWGLASSQLPMGDYGVWARLSYYVQTKASRFVDKVVVNSFAGSKAAINKGYRTEAIQVIHNGVDTNKFTFSKQKRLAWRKQYSIPTDAPLIGIVGRLDPAKGHDIFLKACELAHAENQQLWFVIVGAGSDNYATTLLNKIKKHPLMGSRLVYVEHENDVAAAYSAFDIVTVTSKSESLPNALLEALACERWAVATDVGDCRYVLSDFGEICDVGDSKAIAKAWQSVLDKVLVGWSSINKEPSANQALSADENIPILKQYIESNFSMNKMTTQFEQVCMSLINESGKK